jgi:peptidoglycan/LPS O-acetylase OafA/YrhL
VHLWSLAAEEQFYVLWPPILLVALRRRVRPVALAWLLVGAATAISVNAATLAATGASYGRVWYAPDTHSAAILFGCAAAIVWTYRLLTVPRWIAAMLAVAVLPLLFAYDFSPGFAVVTIPAFALAAGAVLLFVADNDMALVSRLLRMRMLQRVGRISYGVYLWHLPLMIFAGPVSGAILAFPVAAASYRWVEQPFLRRKAGVSMTAPVTPAVVAPSPV